MQRNRAQELRRAGRDAEFPHGRAEILTVGGGEIGRLVFEPGWRWSNDVRPIAGTDSCEAPHFQYHVSGRLAIRMDDGTEFVAAPGDVTSLPERPRRLGRRRRARRGRRLVRREQLRQGELRRDARWLARDARELRDRRAQPSSSARATGSWCGARSTAARSGSTWSRSRRALDPRARREDARPGGGLLRRLGTPALVIDGDDHPVAGRDVRAARPCPAARCATPAASAVLIVSAPRTSGYEPMEWA